MHEPLPHDQLLLMTRSLNTTAFGTEEEQALGSFTRRKLQTIIQLEGLATRGGKATQLHGKARDVWSLPSTHLQVPLSSDSIGTTPSRLTERGRHGNCCDGSPRAAPALKLAKTYSSCIEQQPIMRMFFALCSIEGYICIKVDATNAYANSPHT